MLKAEDLPKIKKMVFAESLSFDDKLIIRDELQERFLNYIFTFNSENDLIIREMRHVSANCRNN